MHQRKPPRASTVRLLALSPHGDLTGYADLGLAGEGRDLLVLRIAASANPNTASAHRTGRLEVTRVAVPAAGGGPP